MNYFNYMKIKLINVLTSLAYYRYFKSSLNTIHDPSREVGLAEFPLNTKSLYTAFKLIKKKIRVP